MVVAAMAVDLRKAGLSVVNGSVGVWPWVSEGKDSHLSHPPLCMSELKMSHSFIQRHGVGRSRKAGTPGEPSTVRTLTDYII